MEGNNPSLFRKLSEPHESAEAADKAIQEFMDEVYGLREKHNIANVHLVIGDAVKKEDGEEYQFIVNGHFGDDLRAEGMVAWALGRVQTQRQEAIGKFLKQGIRSGKNKP